MAISAFWLLALLCPHSPAQHGPAFVCHAAVASQELLAAPGPAEECFEHEVAEEDVDDQALPTAPCCLINPLGPASNLLDSHRAPRAQIATEWHHSQRAPPSL